MADLCPFCESGEAVIFHEGALILGLWDGHPVSEGHALIVPRRHVAGWFELGASEQQDVLAGISIARDAIEKRFRPDGYNIGVNSGEAAGQTVFHLHLHVIPRYRGDVADPRGGVRYVIPHRARYWEAGESRVARADGLVRGGPEDPLIMRLREELVRAREADLAVAFITPSGLQLVFEHLRDLVGRSGGRLRILAGDYLNFTDPDALQRLLDLRDMVGNGSQLELRVFECGSASFHPKAYLFRFPDGSGTAFVGSSNLTEGALLSGIEWNYRIVTSGDAAGFKSIEAAFEDLLRHRCTRVLDEAWLAAYRPRWAAALVQPPVPPPEMGPAAPAPHPIQVAALRALEETRAAGNGAGLVVLATGLGKTFLAAFDSNRPEFKRILFVAHREEILTQAMTTFRRVRPDVGCGRYDGREKLPDADVVFASVQTLGRLPHLRRFPRDRFDYVVVDEFHHAAAPTYRKVIDYFAPKFLLGLTATPERADGGDLLALCQENLVYRCDVGEGIGQKLLCPFQYFGVPDDVDYTNIPWRSSRFDEEALTAAVATRRRAENALEQLRARGGSRTLAFCCSQRHADFMRDFFREQGLRVAAVHAGPGADPRSASLEDLEAGRLDVVCAVDMFNEGVDLPHVDTVLMLRPTESPVIWLQQFGRGLRRAAGKDHLRVIDYIGNHRVFLVKVRTLFELADGDEEIERALNLVIAGQAELPPGCGVTYDLQTIDILRGLLRKAPARDLVAAWCRDFRDRYGRRPTAVEAFHSGYEPERVRPAHGSWFGLLDHVGLLDAGERAGFRTATEFLKDIETTTMTKSFKMLVLVAMLNEDQLPGAVTIEALTAGFRRQVERSAVLRAEVGPRLGENDQMARLLRENPIAAWCGGKDTTRSWFSFEGRMLRTTFEVPGEEREAFQLLVRELAEWRLARHLRDATVGPTEGAVVCRVRREGGRPVLSLPESDRGRFAVGWMPVLAKDSKYEAHVEGAAIDAVRREGAESDELPSLVRDWFGADAGLPGTRHEVSLTRDGEEPWRLGPFQPGVEPRSREVWASYTRPEIRGMFAPTKDPVWRTGVIRIGRDILLLVTLDKEALQSEHQYQDRFLSPDLFEWQSQNQTTRDSNSGMRFKNHVSDGTSIHLFVRRSSKIQGRAAPFIYCGPVAFVSWEGDAPITIRWRLTEPVPQGLRERLAVSDTGQ